MIILIIVAVGLFYDVFFFSVSNKELRKQAEAAEKEFNDFWSETKSALALESSSRQENFCHEVDIQSDHAMVSNRFLSQKEDLHFKNLKFW